MKHKIEYPQNRVHLAVGAAICLSMVCLGPGARADIPPAPASDRLADVTETSLSDSQSQLLDLSFEIASKIPTHPHIKDRSRSQEAVVLACLELGQPRRAIRYADRIENWRRGSCYADIAFHLVQHGHSESARECLTDAQTLSEIAEDWRRDRILSKIAKTRAWLGEMDRARELEHNVVESESGKVAMAKAMRGDNPDIDQQLSALEESFQSGNFDRIKNALSVCIKIYDQFYEDSDKRNRVQETIKSNWNPMPIFIRIELSTAMIDTALDHSDQASALRMVNEAEDFWNEFQWKLEHGLPMKAKLIELRFRAGDEATARMEADALLRKFDENKQEIVNIYRAEALHPLARAYRVMSETEMALAVYKRAVEEGMENPNSRPRAEDLSATCFEMALVSVEPDEDLWDRMHEIERGLDAPW